MQRIDLSLAVNYIPACTCVLRMLMYLSISAFLLMYEDSRVYVVLGALLYVDRYIQGRVLFFDGNSILVSVFCVDVYQHLRGYTDEVVFTVLLAYFVWGIVSVFILLDVTGIVNNTPRKADYNNANDDEKEHGSTVMSLCNTEHKQYLSWAIELVQVLGTAALLLFLLVHPTIREPFANHVIKSLCFVFLVIMWIYLVSIGNVYYCATHHVYFLVRFLPVIVLPIWMSMVFSSVCIIVLIYKYRSHFEIFTLASEIDAIAQPHLFNPESCGSYTTDTSVSKIPPKQQLSTNTSVNRQQDSTSSTTLNFTSNDPKPTDQDDAIEMFKLAKQAAAFKNV